MSRRIGDMWTPAIGTRQTVGINYAAPRETVHSPTLQIPATEPETPQVQYTILSQDLPSVAGYYVAQIYIVGSKPASATRPINFSMLKNGTPIGSPATLLTTAAYNNSSSWCLSMWAWSNVVVDDLIQVKFWESNADSSIVYSALFVPVSRLDPGMRANDVIYDCDIIVGNMPSLVNSGTTLLYSLGGLTVYIPDAKTIGSSGNIPFMFRDSTYKFTRCFGDNNASLYSASPAMFHFAGAYLTQISYSIARIR